MSRGVRATGAKPGACSVSRRAAPRERRAMGDPRRPRTNAPPVRDGFLRVSGAKSAKEAALPEFW